MSIYNDYKTPNNMSYDVEAINNAIKNILMTPIGSLPGKPLFGSRLRNIIFEQMDGITEELCKRIIQEALYQWEDRIIIQNVNIDGVPEYNRYIITINYVYKDDRLNYTSQISIDLE